MRFADQLQFGCIGAAAHARARGELVARQRTLKVDVPSAEQDKFRLGRVGLIAAVGFGLGVLWPRIWGVKLVPSPPVETSSAAAEPATSTAKPPATAAPTPPETSATGERVRLSEAQVTSCRNSEGARQKRCGASPVDGVVQPYLLALADCPAADEVAGLLSLGLDLDLQQDKLVGVSRGRSTTLPESKAAPLLECAREKFESVDWSQVQSELTNLTVFYPVEFLAPLKTDGPGGDVTPASGMATVSWNVALIRDVPEKDGSVKARILSGTRVAVTGRQGDWYRVKYDSKGNEGWVFRAAIGL